jgi:bacillithiol biosynthesis deacetylase BshB1
MGNDEQMLDILAFSPHPDDAELGCGGSLILATDRGLNVGVADLSEGEMSSRGTPAQRRAEKQKAAELLGLQARLSTGLPDTEIGTDPAHRDAVIQLIRETRPRVVLAPFGEDRHPDHAAAGKLVREACFLAGVHKVGAGQPHRPERVYYYMIHQPFMPSFVVDISMVWEGKMAAVQAYKTQFHPDVSGPKTAISQSDFLRFIEARAIWFGTMIGAVYGEAFYTPGPVPLAQLPSLTDSSPESGALPTYRPY